MTSRIVTVNNCRTSGTMSVPTGTRKFMENVTVVLAGFERCDFEEWEGAITSAGGFVLDEYSFVCTHVVVSQLTMEDPICATAQNDGKELVTELWLKDCFDSGELLKPIRGVHRPPKEFDGIPGAEHFMICLTGYQGQWRRNVSLMVDIMGATFCRPLSAGIVTHLVCNDHAGDKYELAKRTNIKIVNERWLQDSIEAWRVLPEELYWKSGLQLAEEEQERCSTPEGGPTKLQDDVHNIDRPEASDALVVEPMPNIDKGEHVKSIPLDFRETANAGPVEHQSLLGERRILRQCQVQERTRLFNGEDLEETIGEQAGVQGADVCMENATGRDCGKLCLEVIPANGRKGTEGHTTAEKLKGKADKLLNSSHRPVATGVLKDVTNRSHKDAIQRTGSAQRKQPRRRYLRSYDSEEDEGKPFAFVGFGDVEDGEAKPTNTLPLSLNDANECEDGYPGRSVSTPVNEYGGDKCQALAGDLPLKRPLSGYRDDSRQPPARRSRVSSGSVGIEDPMKLGNKAGQTSDQQEGNYDNLVGVDKWHSASAVDVTTPESLQAVAIASPPETSVPGLVVTRNTAIFNKDLQPSIVSGSSVLAAHQAKSREDCLAATSEIPGTTFEGLGVTGNLGVGHDELHDPMDIGEIRHFDVDSIPGYNAGSPHPMNSIGASLADTCQGRPRCESDAVKIGILPLISSCTVNHSLVGEPHGKLSCWERDGTDGDIADNNEPGLGVTSRKDQVAGKSKGPADNEITSRKGKGRKRLNESPVNSDHPTVIELPQLEMEKNCVDILSTAAGEDQCAASIPKCPELVGTVVAREGLTRQNSDNRSNNARTSVVSGDKEDMMGDEDDGDLIDAGFKNEERLLSSVQVNPAVLVNKAAKENPLQRKKKKRDGRQVAVEDPPGGLPSSTVPIKETSDGVHGRDGEVDEVGGRKSPLLSDGKTAPSNGSRRVPPLDPKPIRLGFYQYCFALGGIADFKADCRGIIKSLGGRLAGEHHQWKRNATHVILPEPLRRTEKFCAAAASGRWILKRQYLDASLSAGGFVDEEPFEWHGDGPNDEGNISLMAPRKWRQHCAETGCGALQGLRVVIYGHCVAPSVDTLKRVIQAGGGSVKATFPPFATLSKVDFAIVSPDICESDSWARKLLESNIACVSPEYFVQFLARPEEPLAEHVLWNTHEAVSLAMKQLRMNWTSCKRAGKKAKGDRTGMRQKQKGGSAKVLGLSGLESSVARHDEDQSKLKKLETQKAGSKGKRHPYGSEVPAQRKLGKKGSASATATKTKQKQLGKTPQGGPLENLEGHHTGAGESSDESIDLSGDANGGSAISGSSVVCWKCEKADMEEVLLLCGTDEGEGCSRGMHIHCLDPPLDAVPEHDWFCDDCRNAKDR